MTDGDKEELAFSKRKRAKAVMAKECWALHREVRKLMGKDIVFSKLTPTDDVKMEVYDAALKYIFENKDIKNIAIAGSYGAGKSSLLETYKKDHSDKKFLHISLAHFEETAANGAVRKDKDIEGVLEGKILNQLIQQIEVGNIPQTNFHIKRTVNDSRCIAFAVGTVVFLLALLHLKYFKAWSGWVDSLTDLYLKTLLQFFANPYSLFISGVVATVLFGLGLYQLIKAQKNKNIFRKLSVQGNEIEIFGEDDNSYFDKYLNEVLYLFENSRRDVIVFEDLDRFDDNKIFERLREINILANIRLQNGKDKKQSGPLRFFYLLRDDIFVNKDRTKFFDFILPVIPVVDGSNAYDQIKNHLKRGGIFEIFEEKFLRELSLYIDDMRVLKNIYNEFMIYYNKLNTIELNANKMFAMITYKNIFPRDFSDLQLNQGFVHELFSRKNDFVELRRTECEAKIEEKKEQIENAKKEELGSLEELDYVKSRYRNTSQYNEWVNNQYPLRKKAIEDKLQNNLSALEEELLLLQEEKRIVISKKLHEIITRENVDKIFRISSENEIGDVNEYKEIKSSEYFALLKYLIRNGYIDESYSDYMTFFYENSLTKGDKMFLRSITDKVAKPYTYSLNDVNLVMSNLGMSDFEQEEILNFDLLQYLLQNKDKEELLSCFVRQLKKKSRFQFISEFFEENRERVKFVMVLNTQWPQFFGQVVSNHKMTVQQIRDYSLVTLEYMEGDDLLAVNVDDGLTTYIDSQRDYLAIENPNISKLSSALNTLQVSFKRLNYQVSNQDLFEEVYRNSLYEINVDNIRLMLEVEYHFQNVDGALKQCVTSIFSQPEQPLCGYVQESMDSFIEIVLNIPKVGFTDKSADAVMVINHDDITEEHKVEYIGKLETPIESLADIDEEIYQTELVGRAGVKYTVENILEYFGKVGMTSNLAVFINSGHDCLDYGGQEDQGALGIFWNQCIINEELSLKKFREILLSISPNYTEFNLAGVPGNKMEILIEEIFIPMTKETLTFMRNKYSDKKMQYIISNVAEYADIATGNMASAGEVQEIIKYDIDEDIKIKLLTNIKGQISVLGNNYSDRIMAYILKHNLSESELPTLYQDYSCYGDETRREIFAVAKRNMSKIISNPQSVSKDMVREMLEDISITNRVDLFIAMLAELSDDECKQYLELLDMREIAKIFEQKKRPKIQVTTVNQKVLTAMKAAGFINDFTPDENEAVYKLVRNKKANF